MWTKSVSRRGLLDLFEASWPAVDDLTPSDLPLVNASGGEEVVLVWRAEPVGRSRVPSGVPSLILIDKERRREFLAWTETYMASCRPITSLCRVCDAAVADAYLNRQERDALHGRLMAAASSMILCDAIVSCGGGISSVDVSACKATCSFAIAQTVKAGIPAISEESIGEAWEASRRLAGQPRLWIGRQAARVPWGVVKALGEHERYADNVSENVLAAGRRILEVGELTDSECDTLMGNILGSDSLRESMAGRREDRVVIVERLVRSLVSARHGEDEGAAFLCGYLASRIAPGNIEHVSLLLPVLKELPSSVLWYGFCAGLSADRTAKSWGHGLGLRIGRELSRPVDIMESPRCDLSLAELEVMSSGTNYLTQIPLDDSGKIVVEIAPCISSTFMLRHRVEAEAGDAEEREVSPETGDLLRELDEAGQRVKAIGQKLANSLRRDEKKKRKTDRRKQGGGLFSR